MAVAVAPEVAVDLVSNTQELLLVPDHWLDLLDICYHSAFHPSRKK